MAKNTGISWTDRTWNPLRGCSRVSEGCRNCYAEIQASQDMGPGGPYEGVVRFDSEGRAQWTGQIKMVQEHLLDPIRWKKPRKIFVNSMSDLFHENASDEDIATIFAVMALAEQHTFQVLTKRPERMRALVMDSRLDHPADLGFWSRVGAHCEEWAQNVEGQSAGAMMGFDAWWDIIMERGYLSNVWLGVSAEDQTTADARIPILLDTPAACRFISAEPLLGPVRLRVCRGIKRDSVTPGEVFARGDLDWVIVGGESGPEFRKMEKAWAESLRDQCAEVEIPFFFKQDSGERSGERDDLLGMVIHEFPTFPKAEA